MSTKHLHKAQFDINDEYYTRYMDVVNILEPYLHRLKGKSIYCFADDYSKSNFVRYFYDNFEKIGLRSLTATCYKEEGKGVYYKYDGKKGVIRELYSNGDCLNDECLSIMEANDVLITNIPFSLKVKIYQRFEDVRKDFIIISGMNSGYAMEAIMRNRWYTQQRRFVFDRPDGEEKDVNCTIVTTFDDVRPLTLNLTKKYNPDDYPFYDNFTKVINVNSIRDIPSDYYGVMGVPITIDGYFPSDEFEYICCAAYKEGLYTGKPFLGYVHTNYQKPTAPYINGKATYARVFIRRKEKCGQ